MRDTLFFSGHTTQRPQGVRGGAQALAHALLRWSARLVLFLLGLVLAAGALGLLALLLGAWTLRALWLRLTGQPAAAFVVRMGPREAFRGAFRPRPQAEVIDVETRQVG